MTTAQDYPMHPCAKTLDQDRGSRYLQSHTTTHITGGGLRLDDSSYSQERIVSPNQKRESGIRKVTEYSVRSGQEVGEIGRDTGHSNSEENKKLGIAL